jgi:hypothetical protein
MFSCRVKYSVDVEPIQSERPITIASIRNNADLKHTLGFGDNINLYVNGVAMPNDAIVPNDATVVIETAANTKATVVTAS